MERTTIQGEKYRWIMPDEQHTYAAEIAGAYNLSLPIAQTLLTRGFTDRVTIDAFLSSYEKDVASAALMKDAQKAIGRIERALEKKEKIIICGDYDVDGVTSAALMMICLLPLGAQVNFFLPHRTKDGYGLSTKIVQRAFDSGYSLIITVDNGITAFEPALLAKRLGIDLIITDHHRPHVNLPEAFAIVNPNQQDCLYPYKFFAGVGVAFKLLALLYEKLDKKMPSKAYELLMLGTIADVVPLTGENRFWVRYGLAYVNNVESAAFKALKSNGKLVKQVISAVDIGFSIAPQINALGRLEDARQGVRFLIGSDLRETDEVAKILRELNEVRKTIERDIFKEIVQRINTGSIDISKEYCILTSSAHWPPGVIGLVASRLVATYGRPVILLHETAEGIAKGSCRSIPEFNIFAALEQSCDLLEQFGGHPAAAGFSLKQENIPLLKQALEKMLVTKCVQDDFVQKLKIDASLCLPDITKKFMTDLAYLEPFGHGNNIPHFYLKNIMQIQKPTLLKDAHVKMLIFAEGVIKPVIFFNRPELYQQLLKHYQEPMHMVVQVVENYWNGRISIELIGLDIACGDNSNDYHN